MKRWKICFGTLLIAAAGLAGCTSVYHASSGYSGDDLYAIHDRTAIANRQKAEAEARQAEWEARLAEAKAAAAEREYYRSNSYSDILVDDYESAYARRLRGFESPTYRMPSSYYNFRYGSAFTYATAYDPAFYNIIVMGDEVWVEPKYITSMFGTWGRPVYYLDPWYYGWSRPWWGPSFSFGSWGWSFGFNTWYDPWYSPWSPWWGYNWAWGGWGHPHGAPHGWAGRPPHNYMADPGGRFGGGSRYMPGRSGSGSGRWSFTPGRAGSSAYNSGYTGGGTRNGTTGSGTIRYESGGRNGTSPFRSNSGNSNTNNSNNNSNRQNSTFNRGSSSGSSLGTGSRGGSTGGFGSGGSRGGSVGGRGNGGR